MDEGKEQWEGGLVFPCTFLENSEIKSLRAVQGFGKIGGESVAVEKDSDDPYLNFRHSMLQMILKKNIYSKDDLKELLNCFLLLNSPYYHGVIVCAFTKIWNSVFSVKPPCWGWIKRSQVGITPSLRAIRLTLPCKLGINIIVIIDALLKYKSMKGVGRLSFAASLLAVVESLLPSFTSHIGPPNCM
nr:transcription repressor OFP6-like [Ipomoea batatas]